MMAGGSSSGLSEFRVAIEELKLAVAHVKEQLRNQPLTTAPAISPADSWNFSTYEKHINQRFSDLSLQLRERYEAQQTGLAAALAAAEKAVNAALIAAEKAVDKAEGAQQLRNEAQNEFRKSLSDLSGLMWTIKEGTAALEGLRREMELRHQTNEEKVNSLTAGYANIQGRFAMVGIIWGLIVAVVSGLISFVSRFWG